MQKFLLERGHLFGIPIEDEKKVDEEMITEINEKLTANSNEIKRLYKLLNEEVHLYDKKLLEKLDLTNLPKLQESILEECDKQQQKAMKRVAEKQELQTVVKHFDKLIKNLHAYIKNKFSMAEDNDDAMLSKRPLGGFSCGSCEKQIRNLSLTLNSAREEHWNRLPHREPIAKLGSGFSKILSLIKPGGVGGGGSSIMGTALHMLNESNAQTTNLASVMNGRSLGEEEAN